MISIIGKIHTVDNTDPENPTVTELEGYHVNSTELVEGLESFIVEPSSPKQTFFGVPTYFYKFADESEFDLAMNPPEQAEESQLEAAPEGEEVHNDQPAIDDNPENQEVVDLPDNPLVVDDSAIKSLELEIFGDGEQSDSADLDLDEQ